MRLRAIAFVFACLFAGAAGCAAEDVDLSAPEQPVAADEAAINTGPVPFPMPRQCGEHVVCEVGSYCCNASCGICVKPGNLCPQVICEHADVVTTDGSEFTQ